ncbi:hypothetical protein [Pelomonas sp. BJYL3]|uniref:hypothetical protein n=1 Tax=Pelomonas sp. BJYL3 TaxID=2976697 RepID=UPI0022B4182E|nr:hypothetical protein [Pelomonas sp. BJYL3]
MDRVVGVFSAFVAGAKAAGFPWAASVDVHYVLNACTVEIAFEHIPTNALMRHYGSTFGEAEYVDRQTLEDGGELIASQSAEGYVLFVSHPRKSAWSRPLDAEFIIGGPFDPTDVTHRLVEKMIRRHLVVVRMTSLFGGRHSLSIGERFTYQLVVLGELRKRYLLLRSLASLTNEWGKALVAAVLAVVGAIAASSCSGPADRQSHQVAAFIASSDNSSSIRLQATSK